MFRVHCVNLLHIKDFNEQLRKVRKVPEEFEHGGFLGQASSTCVQDTTIYHQDTTILEKKIWLYLITETFRFNIPTIAFRNLS